MSTRNTEVLKEILQTLEISEPHALARLENHFQDSLLVVAAMKAMWPATLGNCGWPSSNSHCLQRSKTGCISQEMSPDPDLARPQSGK